MVSTKTLVHGEATANNDGTPTLYALKQSQLQQDFNETIESRNLTAGTGLEGGGDLSADRTFALADTAVTAATYGSATQVPQVTIDEQGRITGAVNVDIASGGAEQYAALIDQRAVNVDGGAMTAGVWNRRQLNTTPPNGNPDSIVTLDAGTFVVTLNVTGTWRINAKSNFFRTERTRLRLFDVGNAVELYVGDSSFSDDGLAGDNVVAWLDYRGDFTAGDEIAFDMWPASFFGGVFASGIASDIDSEPERYMIAEFFLTAS